MVLQKTALLGSFCLFCFCFRSFFLNMLILLPCFKNGNPQDFNLEKIFYLKFQGTFIALSFILQFGLRARVSIFAKEYYNNSEPQRFVRFEILYFCIDEK